MNLTRRNALVTAAYAGAVFGLPRPTSFIEAALAQKGPEADKGFRPFEFGQVQGFILIDGVWEKPHDPAFIDNVSVKETKAALAATGIANEVVPIPFNITLLKFGNETVLFDAGTGWSVSAQDRSDDRQYGCGRHQAGADHERGRFAFPSGPCLWAYEQGPRQTHRSFPTPRFTCEAPSSEEAASPPARSFRNGG